MKNEIDSMKTVHPYKLTGVAKEFDNKKDEQRIVNLFGSAPSGLLVPPKGEIWCINNSWSYGHKPDKLFVIDGWNCILRDADTCKIPRDVLYDFLRKSKDSMEIYNAFPEELIAQDTGEVIAECLVFPKDITTGLIPGTYFTSSIAHVLAFAAAQEELGKPKVDIINLFGIEIWGSVDADEYTNQTPCVDFWISFLAGRGTTVMIPAYLLKTSVSKNNLYGYFHRR